MENRTPAKTHTLTPADLSIDFSAERVNNTAGCTLKIAWLSVNG